MWEARARNWGGGTKRALKALESLTQEVELSGTTLIDARNGLNELSQLAMLWTVQHCWPAGVRFAFNCYKHLAQLLLFQPGESPITILSRERESPRVTPSLWFCTGAPSSPWKRIFEQRIRGSSALTQLLVVWYDKVHSE